MERNGGSGDTMFYYAEREIIIDCVELNKRKDLSKK